jgi:predicted AlkP superfamily phosphohydrolase/phosphomutase
VYEALDAAVGRLLAAAGGDAVELTIASDHGSGGSSNKVLYLNRVLQDAGFLRMRRGGASGKTLAARLKDAALVRLPPGLRERLFRAAGTTLPSLLESQVRFGAIDMSQTTLFSDELNYFPAIHYNLGGREPRGILDPSQRSRVRAELEASLFALRDPHTGASVVRAVHAREELFSGPFVERAPDLILELELDAGYSYNLMPSATAPDAAAFRILQPHEYLGRKGRSLPGSHRPYGFYLAAGPSVNVRGRINAKIADASATLLARMGVAPPTDGSGRVLPLFEANGRLLGVPHSPHVTHESEAARDDVRVAARLRSLGYIE